MSSTVLKHKRATLERIEKYISEIYFTDVNLYGRYLIFSIINSTVYSNYFVIMRDTNLVIIYLASICDHNGQ